MCPTCRTSRPARDVAAGGSAPRAAPWICSAAPLEPMRRYAHLWERHIWPAIITDLDTMVQQHGGTVAARALEGQPA